MTSIYSENLQTFFDLIHVQKDERMMCKENINNIVRLQSFLNEMKRKDEQFSQETKILTKSIKEKCPWTDFVTLNSIDQKKHTDFIFFKNQEQKCLVSNGQFDNYLTIGLLNKVYYKIIDSKFEQKNIKDLAKIKQELEELSKISIDIYKDDINLKSISGQFHIKYIPLMGLKIKCLKNGNNTFPVTISILEEMYKKDSNDIDLRPDEEEKLLSKIYIKK